MGAIKINGSTSGSTTITAPATGSDETIELSTALASKLPYSYGTATPTTSDSGFLWYDSNSTPPVPKYWNGSTFATLAPAPGLELITTATASGDSTLSINACFSSDFDSYRILASLSGSAQVDARFRFRNSGSDYTSSAYLWRCALLTTSVSADDGAAQSYAKVGEIRLSFGLIDISVDSPFDSAPKGGTTSSAAFNDASTGAGYVGGFGYANSNSADGFTIYPTSGTITGTVRVYGYKNS